MSRLKRGRAGSAVSLFAFQDVMITVIGILILVTLMMSLQLRTLELATTSGAVAEEEEPERAERDPVPDVAALQARLAELEAAYAAVQREIESRLEQRQDAVSLGTLQRLRDQLRALQQRLQDAAAAESEAAQAAKLAQRQAALEAELEAAREALRNAEDQPRIRYIFEADVELMPRLIEVTGSGLRVGRADGEAMGQFDGVTGFGRWLRGRHPDSEYFVMVVKPSGFELVPRLHGMLRRRGFEVGRDFVSEPTVVVDR